MDLYLYRYNCSRWWGNVTDVDKIVVPEKTGNKTVLHAANKKAKIKSGSNSCNIMLLQKYKLSIQSDKCYPGLTGYYTSSIKEI